MRTVFLTLLIALFYGGCGDSGSKSETIPSGCQTDSECITAPRIVCGGDHYCTAKLPDSGLKSGIKLSEITINNRFYVDPVNGDNENGDGSKEKPWKEIQYVVDNYVATQEWDGYGYNNTRKLIPKNPEAPVKAGDAIVLLSGYHGALTIKRSRNSGFITIMADQKYGAKLEQLLITSSAYWRISGVTISPSFATELKKGDMINIETHNYFGPTDHIVVDGVDAYSIADSSGWGIDEWNALPSAGVKVSGDYVLLYDIHFKNVGFGISISGDFVDILGNSVENFAGDGLRGLGSDLLFQGNVVKNCYDVNENHDDGFQSWAIDGVSPKRITLRGNTIINYEDPDQPFKGPLQGIGCFDGFYEDWVVENNLIIVDHYHGITFMGAKDVIIQHNTVVNRDPSIEISPWINVTPHKDERPSSGCVIRNNVAVRSIGASDDTVDEGNYLVKDEVLDTVFVDHKTLDFRPETGSPLLNAGTDGSDIGYFQVE